jgi:hypothetical protein
MNSACPAGSPQRFRHAGAELVVGEEPQVRLAALERIVVAAGVHETAELGVALAREAPFELALEHGSLLGAARAEELGRQHFADPMRAPLTGFQPAFRHQLVHGGGDGVAVHP